MPTSAHTRSDHWTRGTGRGGGPASGSVIGLGVAVGIKVGVKVGVDVGVGVAVGVDVGVGVGVGVRISVVSPWFITCNGSELCAGSLVALISRTPTCSKVSTVSAIPPTATASTCQPSPSSTDS